MPATNRRCSVIAGFLVLCSQVHPTAAAGNFDPALGAGARQATSRLLTDKSRKVSKNQPESAETICLWLLGFAARCSALSEQQMSVQNLLGDDCKGRCQ